MGFTFLVTKGKPVVTYQDGLPDMVISGNGKAPLKDEGRFPAKEV